MSDTKWWTYLQDLMNGQSQLEAAQYIGISKSNITRWKDGARVKPEFAVKVARAYDANVLEALVAADFITEEEAQLKWVDTGGVKLTEATNEQFADEMLRRLNEAEAEDFPPLQAVADSSPEEGDGMPDDYEP